MNKCILGRAANCDIILNDPSVSRTHAEIIVNNNEIIVRDLNSANGISVNGLRIYGSQTLSQNDILKVGNVFVPWKNYVGNSEYSPSPTNNFLNISQCKKVLPNATAVLVLGICSVVLFGVVGFILGVIALSIGSKSKRLYNEHPEWYINYKTFNAGFICAIIGTVIGGLITLFLLTWILILGNNIFSISHLLIK